MQMSNSEDCRLVLKCMILSCDVVWSYLSMPSDMRSRNAKEEAWTPST